MFCLTPGPWAARTSKDAETQNPGLPLESGRTSGPHRRWGGAVRRTSVLPQAKPWRRGNSLAPSMFNPIGAPIQLAVWGICLTPEPWAARTSKNQAKKSPSSEGDFLFIGVVVSSNAVVGALHEAPAQRDRCPPAQRGPHFSGEMGKRAGGREVLSPWTPSLWLSETCWGSCFFAFGWVLVLSL